VTSEEFDAIFKLPFNEASRFFQEKLNIPTSAWDDLWKEQHARGFMAAGAMKADLLADLRGAAQKAIDGKLSLKEFREQFDGIVEKHGWAYKGGRNWRSRLIWDTNITTAYQAGRWRQFVEGGAEYLRYMHADGVINPRPQHLAWNGRTLPIGHPFWKTHFPPNGWGCHCRAVRASRDEVTEEPEGWEEINPRTGAPLGIDKGWDYNVGEAMFKWQPDLDKYEFPVARDLVENLTRNDVFARWHDFARKRVLEELKKPEYAKMSSDAKARLVRQRLTLGEKFPVAVLPGDIKMMIGSQTQGVYLSDYDLLKQHVSRQGQKFEAMDYYNVQETIEKARLIVRDGDKITVFVNDGEKGWYAAALQKTATGKGVFLKSFRRSNRKDALTQSRKGDVLRNELE